jgi:Glutaredoxin-like domain (DUF836)
LRSAPPPGATAAVQSHTLVMLTRVDCSLCEEMLGELAALGRHIALPPLQLLDVDVDADPETRRRYGLKVPVLLLAGSLVCSGRLDEAQLRSALVADRL